MLLQEKVLWLPALRYLLMADVHLGKLEHFRKNGIATPAASEDLHLIELLVRRFNPDRVFFLGDLFHTSKNSSHSHLAVLINSFPEVSFELITGNHDISCDKDYQEIGLGLHQSYMMEGILLKHEREGTEESPVISGHIHPGVLLRGLGRQKMLLPCFCISQEHMLLPSFGYTTGLYKINPSRNSQIIAVSAKGLHVL